MKIYLATDHTGFALKEALQVFIHQELGHEIIDFGAHEVVPDDDYPDIIAAAAKAIFHNPEAKAIIFGGSGQGEAMVANRFPGVRCAVFYGGRLPLGSLESEGTKTKDPLDFIRLSRMHNDANMLSIATRFVDEAEAKAAVQAWLETEFSGDERHVRRIEKIQKIEETLK